MRLLHVNHRYAPFVGGSERFIQEVSEHRARLGDQVTVVTTNAFGLEYLWDSRAQRVDAPQFEELNQVQVVRVPICHVRGGATIFHTSRRAMAELGQYSLADGVTARLAATLPRVKGLRRALAALGPVDVVHATNLGLEGLALAARDLAREQNARFVLTPFLHLGAGDDTKALRHVSLEHQRRLLLSAHAVIAMTDGEAEYIESCGVAPSRIVVSGAGVNIAEITGGDSARFRARFGLSGSIVGSLGAMAADKGTPDLVLAIDQARRTGCNVHLVLVGPELSSFTRWIDALPPETRDCVRRLGFVDNDTKRDFLAAIDVLALPSRTESFGIVYLEAWANRKPVIAANVRAISDVVRNDENGITVPFGDVWRLAAAVRRLINDRTLADSLASRGEDLVQQMYQWPEVLSRVDRAYEAAMSSSRSATA